MARGFAAGVFCFAGRAGPLRVELGKFRVNILARHAFPCAVINIQQIRRQFDFETLTDGERRRGLNRAGQGTRKYRMDFRIRKTRGDFFRLRDSVRVERHIRTAAKTVLPIPFCFAVTDEDKASTNNDSLSWALDLCCELFDTETHANYFSQTTGVVDAYYTKFGMWRVTRLEFVTAPERLTRLLFLLRRKS